MVRIEKDFIGEMEIDDDAYYGVQSMRAAENFRITCIPVNKKLIKAIAMVKMAAAKANLSLGYLDRKKGKAIIQAATELMDGKFYEQIIVDEIQGGAGTSTNMNVNEVIANRALEILGHNKGDYEHVHPNTDVNMAQSTNDVIPTAIKIATIKEIEKLNESLTLLRQRFKEKEEEFDDVIKMGRTQLQDAVPIRLGQEFGAYRELIDRNVERIRQTLEEEKEINLGGTAVGTGLNADPEYIRLTVKELRKITGLNLKSAVNLIDATQNTDTFVEISGRLKTLATALSKIANDLRLLSSGPRSGLNEINLPAVQPGSSIMPGKVNPVMPEAVNQVAFQVLGNDQTISLAVEAGQLELNVMLPVVVFNLLQSIGMLTNTCELFAEKCIKGITANREVCEKSVEQSIGIITAINPHIGYTKASEIAKRALKEKKSVKEIALEEGILDEEKLSKILDPYEMTEPGISGEKLLEKEE
ncbi:aspartate ammonia-lyase [Natroniella acetigena]|uniref:aspartate ammonia-lyase n=1 Tax=Natroniella acetigena TaxID=52004 RepID=UPI00200A1F19|nr:aspartate ammonia-lyase [Natroniella acetigena]MCK8826884.1 aspartate ammonia-lyase [Natroniella acetigena]